MELLFQFGIVVAGNVLLTRIFIFLIWKIVGKYISWDSGYYTLAAFLPTIFMVFLYKLHKAYSRWKKSTGPISFSKKEKWTLSLAVNLFFVFTILVFVPYDVFFANRTDFVFSFSEFWWIMASFALIFFAVLTLIVMFVPPKAFVFVESFLFSLTFLSYIQRMFLNLYVTSMVGETLNTGEHPVWRLINLLIWAGVIAFVLYLFFIRKNIWKNMLRFVSAGLLVVQGVAMVSLLFTEELSAQKHLTSDNLYEVASDNNILVFVLDLYDQVYYDQVKSVVPDFYDRLEGFTYFDNAVSVYSRSYPSNIYLLTGLELDEYYVDSAEACVDKAFSDSTFLPDLIDLGFEVDIYTRNAYVGEIGGALADNYSSESHGLSYFNTLAGMLRCGLYFEMPYFAKPFFSTYEINSSVVSGSQYVISDATMHSKLAEKPLAVSNAEASYKYIHMFGAHPPYTLNENGERVSDEVSGIQQFMGCMNIVYEYLDQMKALGKYDDATIIITADHGVVVDEVTRPISPIFFVKPAHAPEIPLTISHAPVSHTDLFPTIIEAAGGDPDTYGRSIFSIDENETRTRIFHYAQQVNGLEAYVVDYEILNDKNDFENWRVISKEKILQSMYAVQK